ncbi:MAG: hypothetical protein GY715_12085 [Planctomycetes bacterium]|nr:hypothetical protein [Planctomycetota bacterium]
MDDGSCADGVTEALCTDLGGSYQGDDELCAIVSCPCLPDLDGSGDVGFGDILAVIGAWGPCPGPSYPGSFTGLTIEPYVDVNWVANGFTGLTAWRLHANFTDPSDGVAAVIGSTTSPMTVTSSDGVFHNDPPFDSLTAPVNFAPSYWANQWDTYVTIDVEDAADDQTGLTPNFAVESGNLAGNFTTDTESWYVIPPDFAQGVAGPDGQVLLAQFVVAEGETVQGAVNLHFIDAQTADGVAFPPPPPQCPHDLNGNGAVDFADVLAVIGAWGPCW